jgi:hypothetical protein
MKIVNVMIQAPAPTVRTLMLIRRVNVSNVLMVIYIKTKMIQNVPSRKITSPTLTTIPYQPITPQKL